MKNPVAKNSHKFNKAKVEPDKTKIQPPKNKLLSLYTDEEWDKIREIQSATTIEEFYESIGCFIEEQRTNNDWWVDELGEIKKYLDEHK